VYGGISTKGTSSNLSTIDPFEKSADFILSNQILGIKHIHIVYVESFARVQTLSLTGKLLYYVVDSFLVQWSELVVKYPRAVYNGVVV
jgi:beta-1,4-N-acetylglucosaminyltransferase